MISKEQLELHRLWAETKSTLNPQGRQLSLQEADLQEADLRGADLQVADLRGAYLQGAYLRGVNLRGAYLQEAKFNKLTLWPTPTMLLLAYWGEISEDLCLQLMRYDAWCHGDSSKFDAWAAGGECPYSNYKFERAANFSQKEILWSPGPSLDPIELVNRLFKEKLVEDADIPAV